MVWSGGVKGFVCVKAWCGFGQQTDVVASATKTVILDDAKCLDETWEVSVIVAEISRNFPPGAILWTGEL